MRITRIISTIHFSLISLIIFITFLSTLLFIALRNGIVLKEVKFSNLHIKELHVSSKDGLNIYAQSITVTNSSNQKEKPNFEYKDLEKILCTVENYLPLLNTVTIKKLSIHKNIIGIDYAKEKPLHVSLSNENIALKLLLTLTDKYLNINIIKFKTFDKFLHVSGLGSFNRVNKHSYLKLKSSIFNQDKQINYLLADEKGLKFNTTFLTPISKLKEIVDYAELDEDVKPWIVQNVDADRPKIEHLSGYIPFDNPSQILHTLKAEGHWSHVAYTFQKGFEPAKADRVDIYFEKGILTVIPRDAKFYSHKAGSPTIAIDFNPKDFQLELHLDTTARLDETLVALVQSYKIDIPVLQKEGLLKADLTIFINLNSIDIGALGSFKISKGTVAFEGVDYKVHSGLVTIKDANVSLIDLNVSYKTLADAMINGSIQAKQMSGKLDINIHKINFLQKPKMILKQKLLHVTYTLIPHKLDRLQIDKSLWNVFNKTLHVEAIDSSFNYAALMMRLPKTSLFIDNSLQAEIQGNIDIKNEHYELNTSISKFDLFDMKLQDKEFHTNFEYKKELLILSEQNSSWHYASLPININTLNASINKKALKINNTNLIINKDIHTNLKGKLSLKDLNGSFQLENISVNNSTIGEILSHKNTVPLKLSIKNNIFYMAIPKLNFSMLALKEGWRLSIPDISQFQAYSPLMQEYNISQGHLNIGKSSGKDGLYFTGAIEYAYPFLVQDKKPKYHYDFHGNYDENITSVVVNNALNIKIDKYIDVTCKDAGFNISAFIDYIKEHTSSASHTSIPFSLHATNSFIYFSPKRKALADSLSIISKNDELFASLIYKKGGAGLEMHKDRFYLYGKHFNDTFMNNFFSLSEHKGGKFSFALKGNIENFKGVARIDNSRIQDYVLFNNVLAFVNTIPSLASFSLPSYEKEGIKINEAYAAFEYKNDIMHFNAVKFDSGEVDIYGKGDADYFKNTINVKLNLKTHLGKNVSKLPVVGYILVGDDGTAATAFNITGKLDNPTVETALAKDIIIAPFNILKRAIVYPFQLIGKLVKDENKTEELDPAHFLEE